MHLPIIVKTSLASFVLGATTTGAFAIVCELGSQIAFESKTYSNQISEARYQQISDLISEGLAPQEVIKIVTASIPQQRGQSSL